VKQLQSSHVDFRQALNAESPYRLRVQKALSVSINQFRDSSRISDRLVENMIQNISDPGLPNY
jgi:hypothetical protein